MPTEAELDAIRAAMREIRSPSAYDRVFNDECLFSFHSPFSPSGLFVSLHSFQGFGADYVALDQEKAGKPRLYVHAKWTKVAKEPSSSSSDQPPTKMAIGVEQGFKPDEDKFDVVKEYKLVLLGGPPVSVPLPCEELPTLVSEAANALINHTSVLAEQKIAAVAWEAEVKESKYAADLVQLPPTKPISAKPSDWVCEESGMKENLWLNLSDGHIGSGRRQYDGSGGANGALNHYQKTRETHPPNGFPLVVKLGTITPQGADVYSYAPDEDTEVTDAKLAEHLAHWGINMMSMQKTDLSVTEVRPIQAWTERDLQADSPPSPSSFFLSPCSSTSRQMRNWSSTRSQRLGRSWFLCAVLAMLGCATWATLAT